MKKALCKQITKKVQDRILKLYGNDVMRREEHTGKITDGAIVCGGGEGKRRWRDSIKHHLSLEREGTVGRQDRAV